MAGRALTGLRPQAYEHPLDRKTLDALEKFTTFDALIRKCNEYGFERLLRVQLMGSYLRASRDSFPDLYAMVQDACDVLDLPRRPALYIQPGGINAFTAGVDQPIVVLNAGLIDTLTEDQLRFVIGHELGHIKSGHVFYYQMALLLPIIASILDTATLGLGGVFSAGMQVALLRWQRMSELTADRAGLLVCQDVNAVIESMMRLSGLPNRFADSVNTEDFIAQAREFQSFDSDKLDWIAKFLSGVGQTHPWTVMRAHELLAWVDTGDFDRILADPAGAAALPPPPRFCTSCGNVVPAQAQFCTGCGTRVAALPPGSVVG
jgi:Zn-dependent protease with chaperone function